MQIKHFKEKVFSKFSSGRQLEDLQKVDVLGFNLDFKAEDKIVRLLLEQEPALDYIKRECSNVIWIKGGAPYV